MDTTPSAGAESDSITGEWIAASILDFSRTPANTLHLEQEPAWADPLVGFASGDDPLFGEIREHIGDFYWTPREAFGKAYPDARAGHLTVISWVLPQTAATKRDHRKETRYPSERWARSRKYGEAFNDALHEHLVAALRGAGISAVAPTGLPDWRVHRSERSGFTSPWSHRHAAHVAGLGTFGLCDGLITPAGKAMRCGSVVASVDIPPTPRPYDSPHAYCLYYVKGTCEACMQRCPVGAITPDGHNKDICKTYVLETMTHYVKQHFGFEAYGCGLCQVDVPCESTIPRACRPANQSH